MASSEGRVLRQSAPVRVAGARRPSYPAAVTERASADAIETAAEDADGAPAHALLEFGGTFGNLVLLGGLPLITAYFFFAWRFNDGALIPGAGANFGAWLAALTPTWTATALYLGWFAFQAALQQWAPGRWVEGTELEDGTRLRYKMNGRWSFAISLLTVAALHFSGVLPLRIWVDELGALITVTTIFSFVFAAFMYVWGKRTDPRHLTGSIVRDYFMGAGHNPRLGTFDFKLFCEARPGLILWVVLNAAFAAVQYETHGFVSTAMILVGVFQLMYVADYFINEPAILTTMDIKHENFGFMLVFGDLAWVPYTYTLQAAYLVDHVHDLPIWVAALAVAMNLGGLYIFRAVNLQKHKFRSDPDNTTIWGSPPSTSRRGAEANFSRADSGACPATSTTWATS